MGVERRAVRPDQYTVEVSGRLCECGCGERTMVAPRSYSDRGVRKGEPRRFVSGHQLALGAAAAVASRPFRLVVVRVRGSRRRRCLCGCGRLPKTPRSRYFPGHRPADLPLVADRWVEEDRGFETPCWVWQGSPDGYGYGRIVRKGRYWGAHRVSYLQRVGSIPRGYELHHRCEVKLCVNPAHLQALSLEEHQAVHHAAC